MKRIPILLVACAISQTAFAEGLECRRVADPTPRLSCVETPTTAEAPSTARPDTWTGERREAPKRDGDNGTNKRTCRNC